MEQNVQSPSFEYVDQFVRAGAGAGKTTELIANLRGACHYFLAKEKRFPRVVVTTFTRKATQEIRERLLEEALSKKDDSFLTYLSSMSHLHLSTIHGLMRVFLSRYGHPMGLDPNFKLVDEADDYFLRKKILKNLLDESEELQILLETYHLKDFMQMLKEFERAWVLNPLIRPVNIEDLQSLFEQHLTTLQKQVYVLLEHLREEASQASDKWKNLFDDLQPIVSLKGEDFRQKVIDILGPFKRMKNKAISDATMHALNDCKDQIKLISGPEFNPQTWSEVIRFNRLFHQIASRYVNIVHSEKLRLQELTTDDLELFAGLLIKRFPEQAQAFSKEWDYWFVDEYQDTSPIQVFLMNQLIADKKSFVVGDPQQSIYLFRGARSELFTVKERQFQAQGGVPRLKITNYRSLPELLHFINDLVTEMSPQFSAMQPAVSQGYTCDKKKLVAQLVMSSDATDKVDQNSEASSSEDSGATEDRHIEGDGGEDHSEVQNIICKISSLISSGVEPKDIAVLCRKKSQLVRLALASKPYHLPLQLASGANFFECREILDALSFLKFLLNPHDNENLVTLLRSPWFCVSDSYLVSLRKAQQSFWSELSQRKEVPEAVEHLQQQLAKFSHWGLTYAFRQGLMDRGFFEFSLLDPTGKREANLWKLVSMVYAYERSGAVNFLELLESHFQAELSTESSNEGDAIPVATPNRVKLMTIHASKGLQFDHVLIPFIGEGFSPRDDSQFLINEQTGVYSIPTVDEDTRKKQKSLVAKEVEALSKQRLTLEYDRLFYVAVTRAKKSLTLFEGRVRPSSWAERLQLSREPGVHHREQYSYEVLVGDNSPQSFQGLTKETSSVRDLWQGAGEKKIAKLSVSQIVESAFSESSTLLGFKTNGSGRADAVSAEPSQIKQEQQEILERTHRAWFGEAAHLFFETLKYKPQLDIDAYLQKYAENDRQRMKQAMEFLLNDGQIDMKSLLATGEVEWGFQVRHQGVQIEGQVDLWGKNSAGEFWLIDYKTGSSRYTEKAFLQLKLYAWALVKCQKIPADALVYLAAVYPLEKKIEKMSFKEFSAVEDLVLSEGALVTKVDNAADEV